MSRRLFHRLTQLTLFRALKHRPFALVGGGQSVSRFGDSLYTPDVDFSVVDRAVEIAAERGVTSAQIALAWLLHKPGVTAPIVGATNVEHLGDAIAAEQLSLSPDEVERLEEPYRPHAVGPRSRPRHGRRTSDGRRCGGHPRRTLPRRNHRRSSGAAPAGPAARGRHRRVVADRPG